LEHKFVEIQPIQLHCSQTIVR